MLGCPLECQRRTTGLIEADGLTQGVAPLIHQADRTFLLLPRELGDSFDRRAVPPLESVPQADEGPHRPNVLVPEFETVTRYGAAH